MDSSTKETIDSVAFYITVAAVVCVLITQLVSCEKERQAYRADRAARMEQIELERFKAQNFITDVMLQNYLRTTATNEISPEIE